MEHRRCFSLGFKEQCDDEDCGFLAEVVRVAVSGLEIEGNMVPFVDWGVQCKCTAGAHSATCWMGVSRLYKFLEEHFFHLYIHQMLVEGCFNILDHNQMNTGVDFKGAQLNMKMNKNGDDDVDQKTLHKKLYINRNNTKSANLDMDSRKQSSLDSMCKK
jgi:hypothetical protein